MGGRASEGVRGGGIFGEEGSTGLLQAGGGGILAPESDREGRNGEEKPGGGEGKSRRGREGKREGDDGKGTCTV